MRKTGLRTADLLGPHDQTHYGMLLIRNIDDVEALIEWQKSEIERTWKRVFQSGLSPDCYDHFSGATVFKTIWAGMTMKLNLRGGKAYELFDDEFRDYFLRTIDRVRELKEGEFIAINKNGGFFIGTDGMIIDKPGSRERDHSVSETSHDIADYGTKYLVLENDDTVDPWTVEWMKNNGRGYGSHRTHSYICNLRAYQDDDKGRQDLKSLFFRWNDRSHQKEGRAYFIYTTALDVEQMRWYIDLIAETVEQTPTLCKKIVWVPSDHADPEHNHPWPGMKEYAEEKGLEVEFMEADDA